MDEAGDYALALSIALEVAVDSALIASLMKDDRQVQKDRRIAKRLAGSPTKDTVLIAALLQVEEQAEKDHLLAVRLAGGPDVARETQGATATDDGRLDGETYNRLKRYNTQAGNDGKSDGKPDEKLDEKPGVSSNSKKRKMKECIVCRDDFPESDTTDAPCSHTHSAVHASSLSSTRPWMTNRSSPRSVAADLFLLPPRILLSHSPWSISSRGRKSSLRPSTARTAVTETAPPSSHLRQFRETWEPARPVERRLVFDASERVIKVFALLTRSRRRC